MKHTKLQQLTFFEFLNRKIDNQYLEKIVSKHRKNVSVPQRKYIIDLIEQIDQSFNINDLKTIALIYCLHVGKPKKGYIDMFIKDMIEETEIVLTEESISKIHERLTNILEIMNLPKLELDVTVAKNIAVYSEDFKKKFGRFIE